VPARSRSALPAAIRVATVSAAASAASVVSSTGTVRVGALTGGSVISRVMDETYGERAAAPRVVSTGNVSRPHLLHAVSKLLITRLSDRVSSLVGLPSAA
jgi:hypothetical protein